MNYIKIYNQIIRKAKARNLQKDIYSERHHILPISIFGRNNRIVRLLPKEHFISHFLLFKYCKKKYGLNHWKTHKMGYAFYRMTISSRNQQRYTSKSYQIIKEWYSNNNPSKNQIHRERMKGNDYGKGRKGLKHSQETKDKISKANKGRLIGEKNPSKRQEVRDKISKANSDGRTANHGKNHPNYNHNLTIEIRKKIYDEYQLVKHNESMYSFCKQAALKYNCGKGLIQGIIYQK